VIGGSRHLGAGFHELVQGALGLLGGQTEDPGTVAHAADLDFPHALQKLAW
jgi:hypothetical protein